MKKRTTPSHSAECRDTYPKPHASEPFGPRRETLALLSWFARIYTPDGVPTPTLPIAN